VVTGPKGEILLRRRPEKGLLGGMHETPMGPWEKDFPEDPLSLAPLKATFEACEGLVTHTFTHFELELMVFRANVPARQMREADGEWAPEDALERYALPSVMRKIIARALTK
jgi:A/G-specific adenine glycosylase